MLAIDRQDNQERYLEDISKAINNLVERCGGSLESSDGPLPKELVVKQRDLFVHSGIAGILSMAVLEQDKTLIDFFDWLLGYYIHKEQANREEQNKYIVSMLMSLQAQIFNDFGHDEQGPRFVAFVTMMKLALATLDGTMLDNEVNKVNNAGIPLLAKCLTRKASQRRADAEKN